MTTILYSHPIYMQHDMGEGHPECPERLAAIMAALSRLEFDQLIRKDAPKADIDVITMMHDEDYVKSILDAVPSKNAGYVNIDSDVVINFASGEAALRAVGAVVAAVDDILTGKADNAFCAVRPPGHHAENSQAMGFCLFNNVAIAAAYACHKYGINNVAVIDFDVHHGNGTAAMFENNPHLFYASTHQMPLYPGTGRVSETGINNNIVNIPLLSNSGSKEFRTRVSNILLPKLVKFNPDLILISAGFDAHVDDPLGGINLDADDYIWITKKIMDVAAKYCGCKIISSLEGGYDLDALARSTAAHVNILLNYKS